MFCRLQWFSLIKFLGEDSNELRGLMLFQNVSERKSFREEGFQDASKKFS